MYVFFKKRIAWVCARLTTDCDLESHRHEKVNAWICARRTTDHDLESVIPDEERGNERERGREKRKYEKL